MIPNINFNPSFANLAALHNLGGLPHPFGGPISRPMSSGPIAPPQFPMPGQAPVYSGLPAQQLQQPQLQQPQMPQFGMHPQMPQEGMGNLQALMQLLGRRQ